VRLPREEHHSLIWPQRPGQFGRGEVDPLFGHDEIEFTPEGQEFATAG
jgi:hypothetical protein